MIELTREQLEDRLAALHRASLELVRDISLESLLERIATVACDQVQARYAAVGVLDDKGGLERFITVGMTPEELKLMEHPPVGLGLIGELMHADQAIRIPEISAHPKSYGFPANHPPMHSFLGVPIRLADRQLGQIYLTEKTTAPEFSDDDQQVIETLAAYAAIAISNARLYKQLEARDEALTRRNEDLALLNKLAATLASTSDMDEILTTALNRVAEYIFVEAVEVFLTEENGKVLKLAMHHGENVPALWTREEFLFGEGMLGTAAKMGQPRFLIIRQKADRFLRKAVLQTAVHQIACFPLLTRSGVLGVLCIATSQNRILDAREIQFLTAISSWIATAIENVRLNLQGRRLAVLEERERIGMDLHDGIIQSIYAVGLTLEHARLLMNEDKLQARRRIDQAISDLNETIRDIRSYILDLRPRQLHEENLMDGLQRLLNEFRANSNIEATLKGPSDGIANLPDIGSVVLFHICQEALANVAKHSHATHVNIYLWNTPDRALLEISDNGQGFDIRKANTNIGHGLPNMQTRARQVGGDVELNSEPGEGTTVMAWVPLTKKPYTNNGRQSKHG
ncbi:MAG TPA: GAF domain-containing sensor histidine kinase [Anaerolineaceae bacterium]|nr:GAF domain-containing sensor histidine kinase [Anaerolineaceae bacterium]